MTHLNLGLVFTFFLFSLCFFHYQIIVEEFFDIFRDNIDDCFRFGFAIGCKSIRLYSDFYRSDVVVASPLGLKLLIGEEGYQLEQRISQSSHFSPS